MDMDQLTTADQAEAGRLITLYLSDFTGESLGDLGYTAVREWFAAKGLTPGRDVTLAVRTELICESMRRNIDAGVKPYVHLRERE